MYLKSVLTTMLQKRCHSTLQLTFFGGNYYLALHYLHDGVYKFIQQHLYIRSENDTLKWPLPSLKKGSLIWISFFNGQSNYCSRKWMSHSCFNNIKIKNLFERNLLPIYNDRLSFYEVLLTRNGSLSIHHKNIQDFAIRMWKLKNIPEQPVVKTFVQHDIIKNHYDFRHRRDLRILFVDPFYHDNKSISRLGEKMWDIVAPEV